MSTVKTFESFTTSNCYIIKPYANNEVCYIVDLPPDLDPALEYINKKNLSVAAVFLTHGHFDHSMGLQKYNDGNVYMNLDDEFLARNPAEQIKSFFIEETLDISKYDDEINDITSYSNEQIEVLYNPGHTKGSISFLFNGLGAVFTGDFVFAEGIGRTDLYSGNDLDMKKSINEIFLSLDRNLEVYPGHGKSDNVNNILNYNSYLREYIND